MPDPDPIDSKISKYEIISLVGEGGFGRVYKARHPQVGHLVAIKVLTADQDPDSLARFRSEAMIAGSLRHPNVVTIYDFGEDQGRPYLVMEFLTGQDLAHILAEKKPLTTLDKIRILLEVSSGLNYAHGKGIVHRDVKPANIMVLEDGSVKVTDFGIARITEAQTQRQTATGLMIGSVLWMAPEQLNGMDADVQTDIWAYGVTAFEFLSGVHPFRAMERGNTGLLVSAITQKQIPKLTTFAPDISPALVEIVNKCLQRERALRYESLDDVTNDLRPLLDEERRARAQIVLRQVEREYSTDNPDQALKLVREALDLDPQSVAAREWRARLQKESSQRAQQKRVKELVHLAEQARESGKFEEAATHLELAQQIEPQSKTIQMLLKEVQSDLDRQQLKRLTGRARELFESYDYEGARSVLLQASAIDPADDAVAALFAEIDEEEKRLAQSKAMQAVLRRAEDLLHSGLLKESETCAETALAGMPQHSAFTRVRGEMERVLAEARRKLNAVSVVQKARSLMDGGNLDESITTLGTLGEALHDSPDAISLREELRRRFNARKRHDYLQSSLESAEQEASQEHWDEAVRLLELAIQKQGPDPTLEQVLEEYREKLRLRNESKRREQARQAALARADELEAKGLLEEAADTLAKSLKVHGDDERLAARFHQLELTLRDARVEQDRRGRIEQGISEIERLLQAFRFKDAAAAAEALEAELGPDERLSAIAARIAPAKAQWEAERIRAEQSRAALENASLALAKGDPQAALRLLAEAPSEGTGLESAIEEMRITIGREISRAQRMAKGREALQRAEDLVRAGKLEDAIGVLQSAVTQGVVSEEMETRLVQLRQSFAQQESSRQREEGLRKARRRAAELEARGDFSAALAEAEAALAGYGDDEELKRQCEILREAVTRRTRERERIERLQRVRETVSRLATAGDLAKALGEVERAIADYPGEPEILGLRESLRAQLQVEEARRQRLTLIESSIRNAERLAQEKKYDEAIALAGSALRDLKDAPEIEALLERLRQASAAEARQSELRGLDAFLRKPCAPELFAARFRGAYAALGEDEALVSREMLALQDIVARLLKERQPLEALRLLEDSAGRHQSDKRHAELVRKVRAATAQQVDRQIAVAEVPSAPWRWNIRWVLAGLGIAALAAAVWFVSGRPEALKHVAAVLPVAQEGVSYSAALHAQAGAPPYRWSLIGGSVPDGIQFDADRGTLAGTPHTAGVFQFRVRVSDTSGKADDASYQLMVQTAARKERTMPDEIASGKAPQGAGTGVPKAEEKGKAVGTLASGSKLQKSTQKPEGEAVPSTVGSETAKPLPPPPPPPLPSCQPVGLVVVSSIPPSGKFNWSGSLPPGAVLAVCHASTTPRGRLSGSLLYAGWPVELSIEGAPPGVTLVRPPDDSNKYVGFIVENRSAETVETLRFAWRRK